MPSSLRVLGAKEAATGLLWRAAAASQLNFGCITLSVASQLQPLSCSHSAAVVDASAEGCRPIFMHEGMQCQASRLRPVLDCSFVSVPSLSCLDYAGARV